jgi:penicillin amidase
LPFEFDALNYKPEPWQPVDCVKIQRLLAFKQSLSFWGDLILGKIASDEGVKATSEIISNTYYVLSPTKLGDSSSNHPKISDSLKLATKDTIDYGDSELKKALSLLSKVIDVFTATKSFLSYDGIFGGGNIWAAQSNKLYKSSSVLAADNLTTCVLPAQWYQCRLKCKEFDVSGMTVPGMPVFFFGRNESIAWGMTSFPVDDFDFFIEKISNADTNYYVSKNNLKIKFKYISDTIKTKNSAYPFYLKASGKSVIISDFLVPARVTGSGTIEQDFQPIHSSYCLSFSWTGKETTNEFSVLHDIMFSGDVQRFKNAVKRWRTPAACFVYSDSKGNTGLFPAGYIPIRKSKQNSKFPVSAWKEDSYWEGYELLSSIYEESNPAQGFVHYSNNIINIEGKNISAYFDMPSRYNRLDTLLRKPHKFNYRDAQIIQNDIYSEFAEKVVQRTVIAVNKFPYQFNGSESMAYDILKDWDFIYGAYSAAPALFNTYIKKLSVNLLQSKLVSAKQEELLFLANIADCYLYKVFSESLARQTPIAGTNRDALDFIIIQSFKEAVEELIEKLNDDDASHWLYNKISNVYLKHPLDMFSVFKPSVNVGPNDISGGASAINRLRTEIFQGDYVVSATTMRFIVDFAENSVYSVVAGGVSGESMSANYSDQVQIWLKGGYVETKYSATPDESYELRVVLNPKK